MGIRWIIHKKDGSTINSGWNSGDTSFRNNWSRDISSLQLQREEDKRLYTLSKRKNSKSVFWQTDDFLVGANSDSPIMVSRRIFKSLGEDNWIELILKNKYKNITLNVINKKIKVD
jgi:hypothetical protein